MTYDDFIRRCKDASRIVVIDALYIRMAELLAANGMLSRFEFHLPNTVIWGSTTVHLPNLVALDIVMREPLRTIPARERLDLRVGFEDYEITGKSAIYVEDSGSHIWNQKRPGIPQFVKTNDPEVLEFWLRRQPVRWP